jgi:hypothetical protein
MDPGCGADLQAEEPIVRGRRSALQDVRHHMPGAKEIDNPPMEPLWSPVVATGGNQWQM